MAPRKPSPAKLTISLKDAKPLRTISAANRIMRSQFNQHALPGWKIIFSESSLKRSGSCSFHTRTLRINKDFAIHAPEAALVDTILHEIAHMLAGEAAGHGAKWKRIVTEIGGSGLVQHMYEWGEERFVVRCPSGKHEERRVNMISWKKPLECVKCGKWLLYFRPGEERELVEFGGKDPLAKYHLDYEKKMAEKGKSKNGAKRSSN